MASKDKLLASAQKFLSKGQVSKAIGEYQKLVNAFPKDVRNRQKLAELFSRDKRNEEALSEYEAVAKHYTDTGFYLKAIAVFKQMQKIEPSRVDIYYRLAELNEKQGLVGNALTEYRNLVSFYDKNEMHHEAIEVLEKMADLDPENLNVAAKIAECYKSTGQTQEALEKFLELISPLAAKGEHTKVVKLYERFFDLCPEEDNSRLPLAVSLAATGEPEKAIQILKGIIKHSPEDADINKALADAYVANQDFANARLTLKHLLKQKDKDLDLREYYVRICIDAGEVERARDRLEDWKDDFFQAGRVVVLQGFYEELKDLLADDSVVADTLNVIYEAVGDTGKIEKVKTKEEDGPPETADDAVLDEAIDDVETLEMVGEEISPDIEPPSLSREIPRTEGATEKTAAVGIELDLDLEVPIADASEKTSPGHDEADEEDVALDTDDETAEVEIEIDIDDMGALDIEFDDDELDSDDGKTSIAAEITGTEEEFVEQDDSVESEPESAELEAPGDDEELEFDEGLDLGLDDEFVTEPESVEEESGADLLLDEVPDFDPESAEETADEESVELDIEDVSSAESLEELDEIEELEEVEILEEIEALDDVEVLEEEIEELEEIEEIDEVVDAEVPLDVEPLVAGSSDFAAALNVEAELEEAEFYLQQGLYDDAARVVQTLLEYRPDLPELHDKMAEINQGRQSAEEEVESGEFVDILGDIKDDDLLAATDFLDSFGADSEVEDELSQKTVSELDSADTESHFNLGIAYKEMGLYDDAIAEFEKASHAPARVVDCITLTGQCYMEAGDNEAALNAFKKGLSEESLTDESRMTLNFEMGMLHQMNGQLLEALDFFQAVAEKDSFFRDVSELIKNLRKELGLDDSDDDDGPQGNRDRVSYV